ncbi:hypothetical protein KP509_34G023800 [Ceratopteris richardii]|uniref:non-specific serine/threonine protein kinase n=1 Tax=Ceratopteris richardii TaxID=49495 RepID=A0A8T2QK39_CERRI|nr:hypothetical protein KP509_34G023800 [Ceratopteris richardii]
MAEASPRSPVSPSASDSSKSASAPPDSHRISQTSLLFWHTRNNDVKNVERLLQDNLSLVSAHDYDNRTALHVAAFFNRIEVAELLLRYKAPVNATDRWGNSPLADAESEGHGEMADLLKKYGGRVMGSHGSRLEPKDVAPPVPQRCDWEIDPNEIDFQKSTIIGKGSFGEIRKTVWRGTSVAVKTILPSLSDDKLIVEDFKHEVELLVKLRHPNIVQFLGAVTIRKPLMLVTEYLKMGDLHQYMKNKGPLPAIKAVDFALDIARGMTFLHTGPNVIIHRDLKPRNVLLVDERHLKVGDFGLSKLITVKNLHEVYKLTGETGSYRYMAPEVFRHRAYDTKVDVFSFGMILYEMLEGIPPFQGIEPYEAARAVSTGERPEITARTCTPALKHIIKLCWHKDKDQRPTFAKILEILEPIRNELDSQHEPHFPFFHHSPKSVHGL